MKKIGLYSLLIAVVLLTGCSQKEVEVDANANAANSESSLNQVSTNESSTGVDGAMEMADNGVYVTINGKKVFLGNVYFGFDKYDISSNMRDIVKANAAAFSDYNGKIKVEGNCDEWGTDEYNYALGLKRASAVKDALVADGIEASTISLISFGESNPVCSEKNAQCWQKNRRAEHRLLP
ncbi:MAG: OmpA family protein [Arcobacteraceae bacterium]